MLKWLLNAYMKVGWKVSFDDVISAVDDFFEQCNPSTAKPVGEVYGLQGGLCIKKNSFYESILVSQKIQPNLVTLSIRNF